MEAKEYDKKMKSFRDELYKCKIEESAIEIELNNMRVKVNDLNKEKYALLREKDNLNSELKKFSILDSTKDFEQKEFKNPETIEIEIKQLEKKIESVNSKIRQRASEYSKKKEEYDLVNAEYQRMNYLSDSSLAKGRLNKAEKNLEEIIQHNKSKIEEYREENNRCEHQKVKLNKDLDDLLESRKQSDKELKKLMLDYKTKRESKDKIVKQLTEHKVTHVDDKREYILAKKKLEELRKEAEVNIRSLNLSSYLNLLEEVNKRQIPKVYGLLIDLIDINDALHIACNTLLLPKLFTIVVEDFQTGQLLIDLNKELKGGKINIYPLEWVEEEEAAQDYPKDENIVVLSESILPLEHQNENRKLKMLLKDILGKNILVSDLETALMYASDYKLNCVTGQGEIVYSGGFLTKLGYYDNNSDMIQSYKNFQKCFQDFSNIESKIVNYNNILQKLNDEELRKVQECEDIELEKEKKTNKIKLNLNEETTFRSAILQIDKILFRNNKEIEELEAEISSSEKQISILKNSQLKFNEEKFKKLQLESEKMDGEVLEIYNVVSEFEKEKVELQHQLERLIEQRVISLGYKTDKMLNTAMMKISKDGENQKESLRKKLDEKIDSLQEKLADLNHKINQLSRNSDKKAMELDKAKKILSEIRKKILAVNQRRLDIQRIVDQYQFKIDSIDIEDETALERLERKSQKKLIEQLNQILKDTKRKYTEKDRLNFEKLDDHFSHLNKVEKEIEVVKESKTHFREFLDKADENMHNLNENSFINFKRNFEEIFESIVQNGKAKVELKNVRRSTQNSNTEEVNFIDLKVSFSENHNSDDFTMESLSPGQKTVVAICILFSFQKLYPASFYCLDEITADLDTVYVEKVVEM